MELDLRQVRAFVAAADHGNIGRAAEAMFLTQQALSKRLARLEDQLGRLFDRTASGVTVTSAGERFLAPARHLLEVADHALADALANREPVLRVDVWGKLAAPVHAIMHGFALAHPEAVVEVSMRQNLRAALGALQRNEIDVAFGNVANLTTRVPDGLSAAVAAYTPTAGLVDARSELASEDAISQDALRRHGLGIPTQDSRQEFYGFVTEYAAAIGAPVTSSTRNSVLDGIVDRMAADPDAVTLVPAEWSVPDGHRLCVLPIHPVPLFPWYVVWRTDTPNALVPLLLRHARSSHNELLATVDEHWLPAGTSSGTRSRSRGTT